VNLKLISGNGCSPITTIGRGIFNSMIIVLEGNTKDLVAAIEQAKYYGQVKIPPSYKNGPTIHDFNSIKNRTITPHNLRMSLWGANENAVAHQLEFDPKITGFKAQPFTLQIKYDGHSIKVVIDFLAWQTNAPAKFVEAKAPKHLLSDKTKFRLKLCKEVLKQHGSVNILSGLFMGTIPTEWASAMLFLQYIMEPLHLMLLLQD
jgi:hypothetical protein